MTFPKNGTTLAVNCKLLLADYSIKSLSSREANKGILSRPALFNASFTDFKLLSLGLGWNTTFSIKSLKSIFK